MKVIPLLCTFAALAIVFVLQGAVIEQIAYAQMWDFSSNIKNRNNVQVNSNTLQDHNSKTGIIANCVSHASNNINTNVVSSVGTGANVAESKTTTNCNTGHYDYTKHFHTCQKLAISYDGRVPPANTTKYHNLIKAISTPPLNNIGNVPAQEICGTNHDDYIIGSESDDIIFGLPGNDIIMAQGGDDLVFAGLGADIVYGGDGNNQLFGEDGNDNLIGGIGDDLLVGGPGSDRLYGNAGDDILQGEQGADYFDCGDGLDTVVDYTPTQGDVISVDCENVNVIN